MHIKDVPLEPVNTMIANDGALAPSTSYLSRATPAANPLPTIMLLLVDHNGTVALPVYNSHLGHLNILLANNDKIDRPLGNHPLHNVVQQILNDTTLPPVVLVFSNNPR